MGKSRVLRAIKLSAKGRKLFPGKNVGRCQGKLGKRMF